jgi:hypothetical protein
MPEPDLSDAQPTVEILEYPYDAQKAIDAAVP